MSKSPPSFIAGIGGSAGSLNAYKALLDGLPSNIGAAYVIVSHMLPSASSQLAEILSSHTKMRVFVAVDGMAIRADHVYVSSPDADVLIKNDAFKIVTPRTGRNRLIDLFFISLAEAVGSRAIGILLSGSLNDGTEGCRQIKAKGGMIFAQDSSAEFQGMSRSVQASGCVDSVLPPGKMGAALKKLARRRDPGEKRG